LALDKEGPEAILDPSSRQRGRYKITNTQMSEGNFKEKENWSKVTDGRLTPRQTGRLAVGRKLTSTSTLQFLKHFKSIASCLRKIRCKVKSFSQKLR
jgi:hypothetical protein